MNDYHGIIIVYYQELTLDELAAAFADDCCALKPPGEPNPGPKPVNPGWLN